MIDTKCAWGEVRQHEVFREIRLNKRNPLYLKRFSCSLSVTGKKHNWRLLSEVFLWLNHSFIHSFIFLMIFSASWYLAKVRFAFQSSNEERERERAREREKEEMAICIIIARFSKEQRKKKGKKERHWWPTILDLTPSQIS